MIFFPSHHHPVSRYNLEETISSEHSRPIMHIMIPNLVTSGFGFDAESINDIDIDIDRSDYQENEAVAAAAQVGSHNDDDDANDAVADGIRNGTDAVSQSTSWSDFSSMEGGGRSIIDDPISVFYDDDDDEVEQQSFIMHQLYPEERFFSSTSLIQTTNALLDISANEDEKNGSLAVM